MSYSESESPSRLYLRTRHRWLANSALATRLINSVVFPANIGPMINSTDAMIVKRCLNALQNFCCLTAEEVSAEEVPRLIGSPSGFAISPSLVSI
jgi:hypothetical protein